MVMSGACGTTYGVPKRTRGPAEVSRATPGIVMIMAGTTNSHGGHDIHRRTDGHGAFVRAQGAGYCAPVEALRTTAAANVPRGGA